MLWCAHKRKKYFYDSIMAFAVYWKLGAEKVVDCVNTLQTDHEVPYVCVPSTEDG
jgi:hypothetical protein